MQTHNIPINNLVIERGELIINITETTKGNINIKMGISQIIISLVEVEEEIIDIKGKEIIDNDNQIYYGIDNILKQINYISFLIKHIAFAI